MVGGGAMGAATAWALARRSVPTMQPVAGRAHADRAVAALQAQAARHGAEVRQHVGVTGIEVAVDGGAVVHVVDQAPHSDGVVTTLGASAVVVTAGAWTAGLLAGVRGFDALPPLVVTREQPAHFPVRDTALVVDDGRPSFIHHVNPTAHAEARLRPEVPGVDLGAFALARFTARAPVAEAVEG